MRPPIAWYGGKTKLAQWVISHFPPHRIYVEPFGGSGAVLFAKVPAKIEVYNDLHLGVVNFYRCLRDPKKAQELQRLLELTPYSREEFYSCRDELKESEPLDPGGCVRYAWAFAVCSMQLFPSGSTLSWGVVGKVWQQTKHTHGSDHRPDTTQGRVSRLLEAVPRLQHVGIENQQAAKVLERYDTAATLLYIDPPYEDSTGDSRYSHKVDHVELLDWLEACESMVVLSGMHNPLYASRLKGWQVVELERVIDAGNVKGKEHTRKVEVLWLNPACQAARAREQPTLFD